MACYDWATQQRSAGRCVISGFHSQIEKDVLHFLLKGTQPVILVLGRTLYKNLPDELIKPLEEERLLIVSVVSTPRQSEETAMRRNQYIIENADEVVFGSLDVTGNLYPLYEEIKENKKYIIL
jgi:dihydrofolate reductase